MPCTGVKRLVHGQKSSIMERFKLVSNYKPKGDQPKAIEKLVNGLKEDKQYQTLLGVTGSGKTYTVAKVIENINRPTLVISHNKTLAAQLYSEFKEFFPDNAVEYFVSYYDYYQPEAYIPHADVYIEKDASINDNIDRLRLSATSSIMSRNDCIIVASVSCIYGLGSPEEYGEYLLILEKGDEISHEAVLKKLVDIHYERNDYDFKRGKFRVRGQSISIFPAYKETAYRVDFSFDKIDKIYEIEPITGKIIEELKKIAVYPAKHFVTSKTRIDEALGRIQEELKNQLDLFRSQGKLLEAQRLESRTKYDIEMMKELGYCNGIENYSRHISNRASGSRPWCLIDYFKEGLLTIIDESHVTIPQIRGMYNGDRARKETLVQYGFRLPSALDNRPLKFEEFTKLVKNQIFISATPSLFEKENSSDIIEQIIRPTGLIDPPIIVKPTENQIDDLIAEIEKRVKQKERTLVTTITKRLAEDLAHYLAEEGIKVKYLHSEINTLDRIDIIRDLRLGKFDALVGINLLREGLDLPEVSLVAVLDADKEGFLRSWTSLVQVAGRAARNVNGEVILYADNVTRSMKKTIDITNERRKKQLEFNQTHGIKPSTIKKAIKEGVEAYRQAKKIVQDATGESDREYDILEVLTQLEKDMEQAARNLQFERAIIYRDQIAKLKKMLPPT